MCNFICIFYFDDLVKYFRFRMWSSNKWFGDCFRLLFYIIVMKILNRSGCGFSLQVLAKIFFWLLKICMYFGPTYIDTNSVILLGR